MALPVNFKPNLAASFVPALVSFPVEASPKIDGFRVTIFDGVAYTRSLKTVTNEYIQKMVHEHQDFLEGMDCEITVGEPNDLKVFENTSGAVRRASGEPNFILHIFDHVRDAEDNRPAEMRSAFVRECVGDGRFVNSSPLESRIEPPPPFVRVVEKTIIHNQADLDRYEEQCLNDGYEGAMIKGAQSRYKFGRSTARENGLVKIKRREDCEIMITGYEEEQKNNNVAKKNELGRTARSSHKENKEGKGTLGNILGVCLNGSMKGAKVSVGSGFDADTRKRLWESKADLPQSVATIQFFPIGCKDSPRHPVFMRQRDTLDMDEELSLSLSAERLSYSVGQYDDILGEYVRGGRQNGFRPDPSAKSGSETVTEHEDFGSW